jgi:hypothetical protein
MIRQKPAPDPIRGGNRFAEKIMLYERTDSGIYVILLRRFFQKKGRTRGAAKSREETPKEGKR